MFAKVFSGYLRGVDGELIQVESDVRPGLPATSIVGLPDAPVKESRERIHSGLSNLGYAIPPRKITINLAPANTKKFGTLYDFPIAVTMLASLGFIPYDSIENSFYAGEISLDGSLRATPGILPMVIAAAEGGVKNCFVPAENALEASLVEGITTYSVPDMGYFIRHCNGELLNPVVTDTSTLFNDENNTELDYTDVKGQETVKRALLVAAAGMHNILMEGQPGTGKTMMAERLSGIMPPLTLDESISVTKIYSVASKIPKNTPLITKRPFRHPHHTITQSALTGGSTNPLPGEISLAHKGILFLDEMAEFPKQLLDTLRQPLEGKEITIARVSGVVTFPSDFMLVGTMNPCPCGYKGTPKCICTENQIHRYLSRLSGPLIDRIDIIVDTPPVKYDDLKSTNVGLSTDDLRKRVLKAHAIQSERYKYENISYNSQLTPALIDKYCPLGKEEEDYARMIYEKHDYTIRSYHKFLKLARTIADLSNSEHIEVKHLGIAIHLRQSSIINSR